MQRAANVDRALHAFDSSKPVEKPVVRSSSGIGSIIPGFFDDASAQARQEQRQRIEPTSLLPKVRAKAEQHRLSDDATRLLDLIIRADEINGGRQLIDASISAIAYVLDVNDDAARRARADLESMGLIKFHDNGSGDRGFRPKV